jgi:hypothetical protein
MGTLHEDVFTFIISRRIIPKMGSVSGKIGRGNHNTHFAFNNIFIDNHTHYDVMWEEVVEPH